MCGPALWTALHLLCPRAFEAACPRYFCRYFFYQQQPVSLFSQSTFFSLFSFLKISLAKLKRCFRRKRRSDGHPLERSDTQKKHTSRLAFSPQDEPKNKNNKPFAPPVLFVFRGKLAYEKGMKAWLSGKRLSSQHHLGQRDGCQQNGIWYRGPVLLTLRFFWLRFFFEFVRIEISSLARALASAMRTTLSCSVLAESVANSRPPPK